MVQTTKGGVAPKPAKVDKKAQANDKAAMDAMAESPGRSPEPNQITDPVTGEVRPWSQSDAYNSGGTPDDAGFIPTAESAPKK